METKLNLMLEQEIKLINNTEVDEFVDNANGINLKEITDNHTSTQSNDWWEILPLNVKNDVQQALKQADKGQLIPHSTIKENYKKWLAK